MFSFRNLVLLFCLGTLTLLCALQLSALDSYHHLKTTILTFVDGYTDPTVSQANALGIASKIYVLSLPARTDRRRDMEHLRIVLGLSWTYMEAISAEDAIVERIMDSVRFIRHLHAPSTPFTWPDLSIPIDERIDPWDPQFLAPLPTHDSVQPLSPLPLVCATQNDTLAPYAEHFPQHRLLTTARIACWYSHMSVIYRVANDFALRANDTVIILEDDVDMERDIQQRLQAVWSFLPPDWDIVYLGHCWSDESANRVLGYKSNSIAHNTTVSDTYIYPSNRPLCTHAYALSRIGARRLLLHLRHPLFAYSRSIDKAFSWLIESGRLKSFSIVPSVVVQRKIGKSDIMEGKGSEWRAELVNGVFSKT